MKVLRIRRKEVPRTVHIITKRKEHSVMSTSTHPTDEPIFLNEEALKNPPSSFPEPEKGNATWHTLLSAPSTASTSLSAGIAVCPANGCLALHRHKQAEIYYILSGTGELEVDGKRQRVVKDISIRIPGNAEHGVFCGDGEQLRWLYFFSRGKVRRCGVSFQSLITAGLKCDDLSLQKELLVL